MSVSIQINKDDLNRLNSDFKLMLDEVPVAQSRVINRALSAVNTEGSIQVRKYYNLKASRVKKNFSVRKATKNNLSGYWRSEGRPVGLLQFGARKNKKGVSVKVMTDGSRTTVFGAFIQIPKITQTGKAIKTGPQVFWRDLVSSDKRVGRYDINRLEGPRIEDALAKPEVQKALQKKVDDTIKKRLEVEADYILSKAKR
jgi:hypothetical protein